jgi:hypothetical protein
LGIHRPPSGLALATTALPHNRSGVDITLKTAATVVRALLQIADLQRRMTIGIYPIAETVKIGLTDPGNVGLRLLVRTVAAHLRLEMVDHHAEDEIIQTSSRCPALIGYGGLVDQSVSLVNGLG